MSTVIMAACWPLSMSPAQKAVLISLADNANDEGVCWPSIARIVQRTCLSERAVQMAIQWLSKHNVLSISERHGRSTLYTVRPEAYSPPQEMHPRRKCTPAGNAPPQEMHPTPAADAPPPPQQMHPTPAADAPITVIEPSVEPPIEPPPVATALKEAESVLIGLPTNTGREWPVTQADLDEWVDLFPAVNVRQSLRNMKAWLLANKAKRKTMAGMRRFVTSWLTREQDRGGSVAAGGAVDAAGHAVPATSQRRSFQGVDYRAGNDDDHPDWMNRDDQHN